MEEKGEKRKKEEKKKEKKEVIAPLKLDDGAETEALALAEVREAKAEVKTEYAEEVNGG